MVVQERSVSRAAHIPITWLSPRTTAAQLLHKYNIYILLVFAFVPLHDLKSMIEVSDNVCNVLDADRDLHTENAHANTLL